MMEKTHRPSANAAADAAANGQEKQMHIGWIE
jgi:hypothetical protein